MSDGFFAGLNRMFEAGAAYVQHVQFTQLLLGSAPQQRPLLLMQYTQSLSDAGFDGFKLTLTMLIGNEADADGRSVLQELLAGADAARRGDVPPPAQAASEDAAAAAAAAPAAPAAPAGDFDRDLQLFAHWYDALDDGQRRQALSAHIRSLAPAGYERFAANVRQMLANSAERIRQHEAGEDSAWGGFAEDRMAYQMARLRTGQRDPAFLRQLQEYQRVHAFAEWVLQESARLRAEAGAQAGAAAQASRGVEADGASAPGSGSALSPSPSPSPEAAAIREAVLAFTRTGEYPGGAEQLRADVTALVERGEADEVLALLEAAGATEGSRKPLIIADHYRQGDGLYDLRWPLGFPLPLPFAQLDRPTQFAVLFNEWSRREMEGGYALLHGASADDARSIFEECLARAEQLDVPELIARSHEGLAKTAAKSNQRQEERRQWKLALAARSRA